MTADRADDPPATGPAADARRTAVVVAGGDPVPPSVRAHLPRGGLVIAADSGLAHARALGLRVDVVVGDLDSADPTMVRAAQAVGAEVEAHPAEKDATDLELALDRAVAEGAERIVVVGGHGGRFDHLLGNAFLLTSDKYAAVAVTGLMGRARLDVVRTAVELEAEPGSLVSLLAVHGPAHGVTTRGLRYPLRGETLLPGSSRGVSNEHVERRATVALTDGVLVVVAPGPTAAE